MIGLEVGTLNYLKVLPIPYMKTGKKDKTVCIDLQYLIYIKTNSCINQNKLSSEMKIQIY